jgi:hypothetical protein
VHTGFELSKWAKHTFEIDWPPAVLKDPSIAHASGNSDTHSAWHREMDMWKFLLILGVVALAITSGFLTTGTPTQIHAASSSRSTQIIHGRDAGVFSISSASYFLTHPSAAAFRLRTWFATIRPRPSSMLILGVGLLLLGALLRRRQDRLGDLVQEK